MGSGPDEEQNLPDRESMSFDVVIVGAGVAGLSAAIRLRQLSLEHDFELSIVVLEKASEIGGHVLSGAIVDPAGLDQLFPDWRERDCPLATRVNKERLSFLTGKRRFALPKSLIPPVMRHDNCYVGSLGALTCWLGEQAAQLGVEIFPGYAGAELLFDQAGALKGVATPDQGLDRYGQQTSKFMRGMEILGRFTLVAEGARGALAEQIIQHYGLDKGRSPAKYAIGIKELWQVKNGVHQAGSVHHMAGWPLPQNVGGGSFIYHFGDDLVALGLVVHGDYKELRLSPFELLQKLKTHPCVGPLLKQGKRVGYGARTLSVGGWTSMPEPVFPGGLLIGCAAGLFNMARLKGVHTAMLSGLAAAEYCFRQSKEGEGAGQTAPCFEQALEEKGVSGELYEARYIKPLLGRFGSVFGSVAVFVGLWANALTRRGAIGRGVSAKRARKAPGSFYDRADRDFWVPASRKKQIRRVKPDGILTFDCASSLALAGVFHDDNQPAHLIFRDKARSLDNVKRFGFEPAQYYCPAGVYELRYDENGEAFIHISSTNCLHCKMCDIKDPANNIVWTTPPSGGPTYVDM